MGMPVRIKDFKIKKKKRKKKKVIQKSIFFFKYYGLNGNIPFHFSSRIGNILTNVK